MADTQFADAVRLRQVRDAYHKARRKVVRINNAQAKLRELHLAAAKEHGDAMKAYERLRDEFCDAALSSLPHTTGDVL